MIQNAVVTEINGSFAKIEIKRQAICDGCHRSSGCSGCSQIITADVENILGAEVGDTVEIETDSKAVIGWAAAIFVLPIVFFLAAFFFAGRFTASELIQYAVAGIALVFTFAILGVIVRLKKKNMQIKLKKIISNPK